jgi:ASTRA-associated protein 1
VYHKSGCQSRVFANSHSLVPGGDDERDDDDDDDDLSEKEKKERSCWLVAGRKDNRVSLWELMSFTRRSMMMGDFSRSQGLHVLIF